MQRNRRDFFIPLKEDRTGSESLLESSSSSESEQERRGLQQAPFLQSSATPMKPFFQHENPNFEKEPPMNEEQVQSVLAELGEIDHLDLFFKKVYEYYVGGGLRIMIGNQVTTLMIQGFLGFFFLFMVTCIDYQGILDEIQRNHSGGQSRQHSPFPHSGMSFVNFWDHVNLLSFGNTSLFWSVCFLVFIIQWLWRWMKLSVEIESYQKVRRYFRIILGVSDKFLEDSWDLKDISVNWLWNRVLERTPPSVLGNANVLTIANRVLRKENYLISIINMDLLNIRFPVPHFSRNKQLTQVLQWNITFCLFDYVFDPETGQLREEFLRESNRDALTLELEKRFKFMALINLLVAPFLFIYLLVYVGFRYGEEMYRNPRNLSHRRYTNYALWKFREINEFERIFNERIGQTYKAANRYISQDTLPFMSRWMIKICVFVIGSLAFSMILAGLISEEFLLYLEISHGRTLLWYAGVFGILLAIFRSLLPANNKSSRKYDTNTLMAEIITGTHYYPSHWKNQPNLGTKQVRLEFSKLFDYEWQYFLKELLSVLVTPFILWKSLPLSSGGLIDFLREFTVHVDGLGYVCSLAVFDFSKHGYANLVSSSDKLNNTIRRSSHDQRIPLTTPGERMATTRTLKQRSRQGKMEKSFLAFKETFPEWQPTDPAASLYLIHLKDLAEHETEQSLSFMADSFMNNNKDTATTNPYLFDYQSKTFTKGEQSTSHPLTSETLQEGATSSNQFPHVGSASSQFPVNHYLQPIPLTDKASVEPAGLSYQTSSSNDHQFSRRPPPNFLMTQSHMFRQIQTGNPSLIDLWHRYYTPSDSEEQVDEEPEGHDRNSEGFPPV